MLESPFWRWSLFTLGVGLMALAWRWGFAALDSDTDVSAETIAGDGSMWLVGAMFFADAAREAVSNTDWAGKGANTVKILGALGAVACVVAYGASREALVTPVQAEQILVGQASLIATALAGILGLVSAAVSSSVSKGEINTEAGGGTPR